MFEVERYHDFSAGHRVAGHEGKCQYLHGHNYRVVFTCIGDDLDPLGRVIDFGVIKALLCQWLEVNWDHKFLLWSEDPLKEKIVAASISSIAKVPFNPTAENIARFLVEEVGPMVLTGTGVILVRCRVEETRKCSATYSLPPDEVELALEVGRGG